jgi:hypothetical protein
MYTLTKSSSVIRLADNVCIPNDPLNRDWQQYQQWLAAGNQPLSDPPPTAEELRNAWKLERAKAVATITVTTPSGRVFDGDEDSQGRMARAIIGLQSQAEGATVQWVLADNSVVAVGLAELTEALTLAGLRQTELWLQM